jgi:lipopolysaccharide export system ATP-binding protein
VFDFLFGRNRQRPRQAASGGFWRMDLRSLGGPITSLARVALNLPQKSPKARADQAPRPAGEQRQRPPQRDPRREPQQREPQQYEAARRDYPPHDYQQPEYQQPDYQQPEYQREHQHHDYQQQQRGYAQRGYDQQEYQQPQHSQRAQQRSDPRQASAQQSEAFLAVHGVEKSFGGRKVVKGVSLYVRRGEAVGLLGPNGAGKTTVFYMITGLIKADRGRVDLDGFNISALPMYQRARLGIGYLPQEASIFRGLTVEDNIRSVLEIVEPNKRKREAELDNLLEEFHITRLRKTPSIALSGGERRRVEIARALASRPNYMLLDEPFAGIDPIAVGDIQALVRHLTQRGIGVLITDHNVRETLGLTDRAYIIYSGQVLMEGATDDIVNDPEVRRLYLGEEFRL